MSWNQYMLTTKYTIEPTSFKTEKQNRMYPVCVSSSAFTGKERDALRLNPPSGGLCGARLTSPQDLLTGYGYFPHQARQAHHGARYMDHELMTMWLSVDPMADKYPSISPYAYCA